MKLINNWQQAHKALSVILPTVGSLVLLIVYMLEEAGKLSLIPTEYLPFVTTILVPVLAWIGRVIPQISLILGDDSGESSDE